MPTDRATRASRHEQAKTPRTRSGAPNPTSGSKGDQAFSSVPGKGLVHFVKGDTSWKEMSSSQSDFSGQVSGEGVTIRTSGGVGGGGSIASSGLTQLTDSAATPGGGGQYNGIPSGHVNLVYDSGALGTTAKIYNIKSANANLTIEDDEDGNGNAFLLLTAADQSVSLHRFDAIYAEDEENVTTSYANASGSNGIVFQDTAETTWTIGALSNNKIDVTLDVATYTHPTSAGNKHIPSGGSSGPFLKSESSGTAVWATPSYTTNTNTQNTYTSSWVDSSADVLLRLTGGGATSGTQDIKIVKGSNITLTPSGANLTISSTDTNTTNIDSTNATTGAYYSLVEDADTVRALKAGNGISMTEDGSASGGDAIEISSTVDTSGLLTNGIVTIDDWNGSEVEESVNASGPDTLRFVENDGIEWSISGPTNNKISVTPSLAGYNASNWNAAYTHSQATHAPTNADNYSSWTIKDHDGTTYTVTSGDTLWIKEGTGIDVNFTADDELTITSTVTNTDGKWDGGSTDLNASNGRDSLSLNTTDDVRFDSFGVGTNASGTTGEIRATNEITAYYSDDRLKNKYGNIENALEKVCSLNGFHYQPNETAGSLGYDTSKKKVGVSAQEVLKVLPEAVTEAPIDPQYHTVQYEKLVPLLVEAIKELNERKCGCGSK